MSHYTDKQVDVTKWDAAKAYVRAYNEFIVLLRNHSTYDPLVRQAWKNLMVAKQNYRKAAKM